MENEKTEREKLVELAKERIEMKNELRTHIIIYIAVNLFLVFIWAFTGDIVEIGDNIPFNNFWPIWTILGWGIGVICHIISVINELSSRSIQKIEKEIDKEIEKMGGQ